MLLDQPAVKSIVSGRNGRVGCEDGVLSHIAESIVEAHPVVFHTLTNSLERSKCTVSLVKVVDAWRDSQSLQGPDTADSRDQLLANTCSVVATIEPTRQFAILGGLVPPS